MASLRILIALTLALVHMNSAAMPAPRLSLFQAESAINRHRICVECYEFESGSIYQRWEQTTGIARHLLWAVDYAAAAPSRFTDPTGEIIPCMVANYARCLVTCGIAGAVASALTGDCLDLGDLAKDCLTSCLWSMLPIPDPCGKFGKLFSTGIGLANSFEQDTLVHTRVLTDQGYVKQLKRIADIQVGDEVLAWDEVKAFDIAQAKENLKLQANLQAKSADSRQEICAECYENSSASSNSSSQQGLQTALLQSAAGTQLTDSAESYQKVTHLMNSIKEQTLYFISLDNGEVFTATAGHPFKTNEGWRDAVMLKKGGKLLLKGADEPAANLPLPQAGEGRGEGEGERYATITSIREEVQTIRMYNFEVGQLHTYFIGVDGVVVHNANALRGVPGTYEFPDLHDPGKMYVGKAADLADRTGKWQRRGRCAMPGVNPMPGSTDLQRRIAEQKRIQELGGIGGGKVSNTINPIDPLDWPQHGIF